MNDSDLALNLQCDTVNDTEVKEDDILTIPVKRSNLSTAGKRPARLDPESPPVSPNHNPNADKKSHHNKRHPKDQDN